MCTDNLSKELGREKRSKNKVFCETWPKVGAPWFFNAKQHNFELSWSSNTWRDETCVLSSLVTLANSRAAHSARRLATQQQPAGGVVYWWCRQPPGNAYWEDRNVMSVQSWREKPQMAQCHAECQTLRHASEPFPSWPTCFETLFLLLLLAEMNVCAVKNAFKHTFQ